MWTRNKSNTSTLFNKQKPTYYHIYWPSFNVRKGWNNELPLAKQLFQWPSNKPTKYGERFMKLHIIKFLSDIKMLYKFSKDRWKIVAVRGPDGRKDGLFLHPPSTLLTGIIIWIWHKILICRADLYNRYILPHDLKVLTTWFWCG